MEISTISMLASRSGIDGQLKFHMMAGLNVGLTREEIEEIIIHTVPYSGFPTAINALNTLKSIE
jgi:4-carboxymuconolactone decarboxylase